MTRRRPVCVQYWHSLLSLILSVSQKIEGSQYEEMSPMKLCREISYSACEKLFWREMAKYLPCLNEEKALEKLILTMCKPLITRRQEKMKCDKSEEKRWLSNEKLSEIWGKRRLLEACVSDCYYDCVCWYFLGCWLELEKAREEREWPSVTEMQAEKWGGDVCSLNTLPATRNALPGYLWPSVYQLYY